MHTCIYAECRVFLMFAHVLSLCAGVAIALPRDVICSAKTFYYFNDDTIFYCSII
jgi:hypothetical protein